MLSVFRGSYLYFVMKISQLFVLLFLFNLSEQKVIINYNNDLFLRFNCYSFQRRAVYFSEIGFKFNPVYMNGTFDKSQWINNTREHPNHILGRIEAWFFKNTYNFSFCKKNKLTVKLTMLCEL